MRRAIAMLGRLGTLLRAILGVPDYERYLTHHHRAHPHARALSRDEFLRDVVERRYSRPGSRCC